MYYSPILFSRVADLNLTQFHKCVIDIDYLNSKEQILIYCLNSMHYLGMLEPFIEKIQRPFIIITAMEDTQFPEELNNDFITKIYNNIYFKHWFAINKTSSNDEKITSIPYGLDYWTLTNISHFGENKQDWYTQNNILENIIIICKIY
jgi:hypothetical protein